MSLPAVDHDALLARLEAEAPPPAAAPVAHANGQAPAANGHAPPGHGPFGSRDDRATLIARAAAYIDRAPIAIAGQSGHDRAFDVACTLVKGFDLTVGEARPIFAAWAARCDPPWSEREVEHKMASADAKADDKPRGWLARAERDGQGGGGGANGWAGRPEGAYGPAGYAAAPGVNGVGNGHAPHDAPAIPPGDITCPPGLEANPERLARLFLQERYYHPDGYALRFWQGVHYAWTRNAYRVVDKGELRAEVTRSVAHEFLRLYNLQMMRFGVRQATAAAGGPPGDEKAPKLLPVSTNLVGDVIQAIGSMALVRGEACRDMPVWVDRPGERDVRDWPPGEVLPTANALVHLPSLVEDREAIIRPTPAFFGSYALDYAFDMGAPTPTNWLTFLGKLPVLDNSPVRFQLWPHDPQSIDFLQEWFGYHLERTTRQQKALAMIGPRRSGKGTIAFILGAMIGTDNVAGPTLSSLGTQFGLATLIGKPAAIIDDARLSGKTDVAVLIERLLSITGEGRLDVDRKNLPQWTGTLSCKFTIITNETPRLPDASSAIAGRLMFLHLTESFFGREDPELKAKLLPELPGILNWAIEGWHRLHARGHFVQPESGKSLAAEMEEMGSPIMMFLRERCLRGVGYRVRCDVLYADWRSWCTEKGYDSPGNDAVFGRNIRSVYADIEKTRIHVAEGGAKKNHYAGIRLRSWDDPDTDDEAGGPDG